MLLNPKRRKYLIKHIISYLICLNIPVIKSKLELSAKIPRLAPSVRLSLLTTDEPLSPAYVPTDFLIAFLKT